MDIREFEPGDQEQVISLWVACDLTRPWNDPAKDIARKLVLDDRLFLVGELEGTVVASVMAGYDGHRGWINYLAVDPAHQHLGMARLIMDEAESRLRDLGCPKVNLQVRATNINAMAFYERVGYEVDDVVSYGKRLIEDTPAP